MKHFLFPFQDVSLASTDEQLFVGAQFSELCTQEDEPTNPVFIHRGDSVTLESGRALLYHPPFDIERYSEVMKKNVGLPMMLHDDLISWAIGLLNLYFARTNTKTVILGTQFYTQLRDCKEISSERGLKNRIEKLLLSNNFLDTTFADLEYILFIIHVGRRTQGHYLLVHSCLVLNDNGDYEMIIYDSCGSQCYNNEVLSVLKRFLMYKCIEYEKSSESILFVMESGSCSVQDDSCNCGVFVLLNLIKIAQGGTPTTSDITKTQVNLLRDQLMWTLMAYITPTDTVEMVDFRGMITYLGLFVQTLLTFTHVSFFVVQKLMISLPMPV